MPTHTARSRPNLTARFGGRYAAVRLLGAGAFGQVWEVIERGGKRWALKIVRPKHPPGSTAGRHDPALLKEREALEACLNLRHPFLIGINEHAIDPTDGLLVVMELADGSLADQLPGGRPAADLSWLLRCAEQAADALDHLHAQRPMIVHRDVKPANLLLLKGHVKVADLGLARLQQAALSTQSQTAGSLAYMAPEILADKRVGPASDQYSLAHTYAHLRQGRPAVPGPSLQAIIDAHTTGRFDLNAGVMTPAEVVVLRKAMARVPADRFPTCTAFVRELAAAVRGPVYFPLRPPSPPVAPAAGFVVAARQSSVVRTWKPTTSSVRRPVRRHTRVWAAVLVLLLAVAGGLLAAACIPRPATNTSPPTQLQPPG